MVQQRPDTNGTSGTGGPDGVRLSSGVASSLTGVGLLVVFMAQNREDVTLHFLLWSFAWPLWLFTLVVAVRGGREEGTDPLASGHASARAPALRPVPAAS